MQSLASEYIWRPGMTWRRVVIAVALCANLAMPPASAQTAGIKPTDTLLEEIVVTGSMLRRTDHETESPVTMISADEIKRSGLTTISDVVRSISADNSGSLPTAFGTGFAAGAAGVALRGLTVNSTLVLIDGRRAAPYALADDGQRSFVDLNTMPLDAVERIEVLKDGASSLYGADAIAGVVNVILKKQYTGAEVSAEVGKGQHPGGGTRRFTASFGVGDLASDRYNAYVNFEFQGDDRILAGDRRFPFNTSDLSSINGFDSRVGYPGSFTGATSAVVAPAAAGTGAPAILNTTQVGVYQPLTSCTRGTVAGSADSVLFAGLTDNYCVQDQTGYVDDQSAQQRTGVSARFTAKIGDNLQAYINGSYFQNNVYIDGRPAQVQNGLSFNTENIALPPTLPNGSLNPNNPFASQGEYAQIQYAFGDIPNATILKNHSLRLVTGLKGTARGWDFDTALVFNHTWLNYRLLGLLSAAAELQAVTNGTYNFVNPAANTPAARAAIAPMLEKTSTTDMDSIDFRATRSLAALPGGDLGVALGVEARYEAQYDPSINPNNDVQGLGNAKTVGSRNVEAAYFEFGLPLLKSLSFDLSGRFDHYSDFGDAFTPKAGFKWTPIKALALRGTYSKGFRAPAFAENGSSSSQAFSTIAPSAGPPFPVNFCDAAVHSTGYCLPYSIASLSLANPNIKPEKSDSYTFGVILEPIARMSASLDFYAIKKRNVIEPPDSGSALLAYLSGQPIPPGYLVMPDLPDPAFPNSLARPLLISGLYVNENSLQTDGVDIDLRGHFDFERLGQWISNLSITKIFSFKLIHADGTTDQYVGTEAPYNLSSGAGTPRYRGSWINTWIFGPATATLTTYYVSGFKETGVDATGDPNACLYTDNYCHVASFTDFDLTGSYRFSDHITASAAIENLFDTLPPINPANYAGQNYNPAYHQAGIVGRMFRVGASYKF